MLLESLFRRCLSIDYIRVGNDGDYACERIGNTLYLYFQGSNGAMDWKNNLDFPIKPYKRMDRGIWLVHRGFLRVWKSVEPYISPLIDDESIKEITIAGYSHGGALAVLCHEYIWYHREDLRKHLHGYGFGCPKVLWGILGNERHRWDNFTVVRNLNDLVTHLPPCFLGFRHVGEMMEIGARGKYSMIDAHRSENIITELTERTKRSYS